MTLLSLRIISYVLVCFLSFSLSAQTANPSPGSEEKSLEEYKVKKNDSLTKIAKEVLNDPGKWKEFLKYNQIQNPSLIKEGMVLKVPVHLRKVVEVEGQPMAALELYHGVVEYSKKPKEGNPVWSAVSKNQILRDGESLKTGVKSGAFLAFVENETKVKIFEKSSFRVSKKEAPEIFLENGQLQADVKPGIFKTAKKTVQKLVISTPVAVVGVRGTKFYVNNEGEERSDVGCFEGTVNVAASGKDVDVKAGFGTYVEKGKPPVEPFPIPGKIQIDKDFQNQ
ncbi:FecR domain-containing protein [Leptospira sanjuanensis]|uniref:FecR domain-containing protein n=1 Tax=Leptospira sanjuanensis TaxID=2879643 RepID=UPI001EE89DDC|nr:FecR domain-containing protein [Leptospira sanjuanensis]MCG6168096.1 FecR domain-containing protein [Leptospira sanjuanensis]